MKPIRTNTAVDKTDADAAFSDALPHGAQSGTTAVAAETRNTGSLALASGADEILAESLCLLEQTQELLKK